ncbi:MAG: LacI family DNA-binding transcriptional regulator [Planctomycetota bacterium]
MRPARRTTLRDVAEHAKVSVSAVSDILNRGRETLYAEDTRKRVLDATRTLGYVPEKSAQTLRRGRSGSVGVVLTRGFGNPYFARLAETIDRALDARGIEMQLILVAGRVERAAELARRLIGGGVDGVIIGPLYPWDHVLSEQIRTIDTSPLPAVVFGNVDEAAFTDTVLLNDFEGGRVAVDHLVRLGHRRIGMLGSALPAQESDKTFSNQDGIEHGLRERGLLEHAKEWFIPLTDESTFAGYAATAAAFSKRYLAAEPDHRPTAMVCKNDLAALTALFELSSAGVRVPDDLSILGFDNMVEGEYSSPPLSSVEHGISKLGERVVQRLMTQLNPDTPEHGDNFQPFVNERQSTGAVMEHAD